MGLVQRENLPRLLQGECLPRADWYGHPQLDVELSASKKVWLWWQRAPDMRVRALTRPWGLPFRTLEMTPHPPKREWERFRPTLHRPHLR